MERINDKSKNKTPNRVKPQRPMPDRIDASPEEIAEAVLRRPAKAKEDWRYLKERNGLDGL